MEFHRKTEAVILMLNVIVTILNAKIAIANITVT